MLTALLGCAVLAGAGSPPADDDLPILRELRPAQRENLVIVRRNGAVRMVSYDPAVQYPQIAELAQRGEQPHSYVPTRAGPKPAAHLTATVKRFDLAWLYAHRFDAPGDDRRVPGVPVRSQVGSPFDIDSGAFHGVRAINGWSAVRVSVSI
ncbi:MAG TPA: hypothetical protein VIJ64_08885, partial [Candidatus Lustribacter sp.]